MKIKIWGCRGSLPVCGKEYQKYGGNTTCVEVILSDGNIIILDAGSGIYNLGKKLIKENSINELYIILTHSHWDHMMGFPFFKPAYYESYNIHIRGGPIAKESLRKSFEHIMEPPYFPVRLTSMRAKFDFTHGIPIVKKIGESTVYPIPLNHPNGGFGYKIVDGSKTFVFLPDNELDYSHKNGKSMDDYIDFCNGADLLIHDSQYTPEQYKTYQGWGHSKFNSALNLAVQSSVKNLGLFHHDPNQTDNDIDRIVNASIQLLEKWGVNLNCFACYDGQDIEI